MASRSRSHRQHLRRGALRLLQRRVPDHRGQRRRRDRLRLRRGARSHHDFKGFRPEQADAFQRALLRRLNRRTNEPLGKGTVVSTLRELKRFFFWLADQQGYRRLQHDWAANFNPPRKLLEVAKARREPRVPTLKEIHDTIAHMPATTGIERRNRAILAAIILTGGRDDAVASLMVKQVDIAERAVHFDAREVRTKIAKSFPTWFFPVGGDAEAIVRDWVEYLATDLGFGPDDALFPSTVTGFDSAGRPLAPTLGRERWATANPVRLVFREAFNAAGLRYYNPHSFRSTLARLGMEICRTPEELKAWSQNLGHDDVLTTLTSYGEVPFHRQRELIRATTDRDEDDEGALELARTMLAAARKAA
jgi:site-specific recombinase XerC